MIDEKWLDNCEKKVLSMNEQDYIGFEKAKELIKLARLGLFFQEKVVDKLDELVEHTSSHLDDMEHYFENKCCPTVEEVNSCARADSELRLLIKACKEMLSKLPKEEK